MGIDGLRLFCLQLPHTTEQIQWGSDLVFKIGGKMYAVAATEPAKTCLSFKCSAEDFAELTEREGVIPAPYLARAQWVALEHPDALTPREIKTYVAKSYENVLNRLPKAAREKLGKGPVRAPGGRAARRSRKAQSRR